MPAFAFETIEAQRFGAWASQSFDAFAAAARETTGHGRLRTLRVAIEGNHTYLILEFLTGDAAGQNMATIAADAICRYIEMHAPIACRHWFVEATSQGRRTSRWWV